MRFWMWLCCALPVIGAENPVRLASEARVQLVVSDGMAPLGEVRVSEGAIGDGSWLKEPGRRERLTDITFPIDWWRAREVTVSFTPQEDGKADLTLSGPWAEQQPGVRWRQETVWDEIRGEGVEVVNGSFDVAGEGAPRGWASPWKPYPAAGEWPAADGTAASWEGRPLVQTLELKKGREVRLTFTGRAATPPDFVAPKRLSGETEAHRYLAGLKRGMNLGNAWEAPLSGWGIRYDTSDVDRIADQGFDHIRVPVAWHLRMRDGVISADFLAEIEPVLRRALERKLRVIVNWHHFDDLVADPQANRRRFVEDWKVVAGHFADWPPELCLELYNEPRAPLDGELLNGILAEAIAAIRENHPDRTLMVNPSNWGSVKGLGELRLPDDEENVIVSVHSYEPFEFTHQRAGWANLAELRNVVFPGPPDQPLVLPDSLKDRLGGWVRDYNILQGAANPSSTTAFERLLDDAVAWSEFFGRPVHVGEFGAYRAADEASRGRYARAVRTACESRGLPWCWWEWKAGFAYWDSETERPLLRGELMGK